MGALQSVIEEFKQGVQEDRVNMIRRVLDSLGKLVEEVKSSKGATQWQTVSYGILNRQFKTFYAGLLQEKAQDSQAEAFLTEFSKLQYQWNQITRPSSYPT